MIADRPFQCDTCEKSFKLEFHLKRHKGSCKQFSGYITCEDCGKKLVSKRVLKVHKASCSPSKVYSCSECETTFEIYAALADHRKKQHSKTMCDFCDHECHVTNLKRHMQNKHKGLRPSSSKKPIKTEKKYQCEKCEKFFFDKSTLNRHVRTHKFKCGLCTKMFSSKQNLEEHTMVHQSKDAARKPQEKQIKTVSWSENLEEVKEIAVTKVPVNHETFEKILDIQKHTDNILMIYHNRGQNLKMEELCDYIERQTHKTLQEITLKAMLSVNPNLYIISIFKKEMLIQMKTVLKIVTPSTLATRRCLFKSAIKEIHETSARYIDLVSFPEFKKTEYKSAIDILKQNIVHFSEDEDEEIEQDDNLNSFAKLVKKIEKKGEKKARREKRFGQIDWQLRRLPGLARAVNSVYCSEQKSSIKLEILASKVGNNSKNTISDLERLIKDSKGWLIRYKDWVKRKSSANINDICKSLV